MDNRIVCRCKRVTSYDIIEAVHKGAYTLEDVARATKAATGCGSCITTVERLISYKMPHKQ